jgi:hypothetical protein
MPKIVVISCIIIAIYRKEHNPSHFHAFYGGHEVLIKISDLSVYAGSMPNPQLRRIVSGGKIISHFYEISGRQNEYSNM